MRGSSIGYVAVALVVLAGCSTTSPDVGGNAPPSTVVASGGSKVAVCSGEASRRYGVAVDALSLSNDYPTGNGDAIDGAAMLAQGFKRFRCAFDHAGTFIGITDITGQA